MNGAITKNSQNQAQNRPIAFDFSTYLIELGEFSVDFDSECSLDEPAAIRSVHEWYEMN